MRYVSPFVHALCFCCMGRVVNNGETLASFKISFLFTELLFSIIPLLIRAYSAGGKKVILTWINNNEANNNTFVLMKGLAFDNLSDKI